MSLKSYAQNVNKIKWKKYGVENGLRDVHINSVRQDSVGFIWIGTDAGLVRFDGHDFLTFQHARHQTNGLQGNVVEHLWPDGENLWLTVRGKGLHRLNTKTENIDFFEFYQDSVELIQFNSIHKRGDYLWLAREDNEVVRFSLRSLEFEFLPWGRGGLYSSFPLENGNIVVSGQGSGASILELDEHGEIHFIRDLTRPSPPKNRQPEYTLTHYIEHKNILYMGGWDNALHILATSDSIISSHVFDEATSLSFVDDETSALIQVSTDVLWVATKNGKIYRYIIGKRRFEEIELEGINTRKFNDLFQDKQGGIWLATDNGLYYYHPQRALFTTHTLPHDKKVNALLIDSMDIFIGTTDGLIVKNKFGNDAEILLSGQEIHSLYKYKKNQLIIGTSTTLYTYHEEIMKPLLVGEYLEAYPDYFDPKNIDYSRYNSIAYRAEDSMLLASAYGHVIVYFDPKNEFYSYYKYEQNIVEHLVNKIYFNAAGEMIILGTDFGLHINATESQERCDDEVWFSSLSRNEQVSYGFYSLKAQHIINTASHPLIESNEFYDIKELKNNTYWTTSRSGLYYLDLRSGLSIKKANIPFHRMEGIQTDKNQNLWIVTNGGVLYYNPNNGDYQYYNTEDGLPAGGVSGYLEKDDRGLMYVGGQGCVVTFDPNELLAKPISRQQIEFTGITSMTAPNQKIILDNEIEIHERNNIFSMSYTSFPYFNSKSIRYEYQISGISQEWLSNGSSNNLLVTKLAPGHYNFRVRAKDKNGVVVSNEGLMHVRIKAYWYKRWWFVLSSILLLLYLTYSLYKFLTQQRKRVQQVRKNIARDLHDDVGSTLGSISIFSEAAASRLELGQQTETKDILDKIGINSRLMIEKINDIVWTVNSDQEMLFDLIDRMESFARNIFSEQDIQFSFSKSADLENRKLDMNQRKNVYLIFKEIIHNIFKHAQASHVIMHISSNKNLVHVKISDDGVGFDRSTTRMGNGLENMESRAREIGGSVTVDSAKNRGTVVDLWF